MGGMYLGIDLGTSGVKALLIAQDQSIVASQEAGLSVSRPQPGWSEQEPRHWIEAAQNALASLKAAKPKEFAAVRGIGLSGQMHGATLLDARDEVLRPCILWNDTRSHVEAAAFDADPRFRAITGNIVFPGFTAPKLAWVKNNEPNLFGQIAKILLPKDYLRLWLSGEHISDMSDSSGTSWLNTGERDWSDALLEACELNRSQMPSLVEGCAPGGALRKTLADEWGLDHPVTIAGGAGDNAASAVGMGVVRDNDAFVSLGTSGVLFAATGGYRPKPESAVHAFCHALPDLWHQMGVILSATDALNWYATIAGVSAKALTDELGAALSPPSPATFLPYLSGERTPHNDPAIRGVFTGLSHDSDRQALTRAVLEGVAFALRDNLAALESAGTQLRVLTAVGGGSRSAYWLDLIATVLNRPIRKTSEGDYGAALGAARLGMMAAEGYAAAEICMTPEVERIIEPRADLVPAFDEAYHRFRTIYRTLKNYSAN